MPRITLENVTIDFPVKIKGGSTFRALEDVSFEVGDREFVCIIGPSGCGKSTAMNLVAGFNAPTGGRVLVDGQEVRAPNPERGVVFQDANIFPWLTVWENVAFGPSLSRRRDAEMTAAVERQLKEVGLAEFKDHLPIDLSGGMRQRVGLARVLVNNPQVLLMDEPFGALDAQTRIVMQELLLKIWERDQKTVIFVTHDIDEALLLADRILVMTHWPGRIKDEMKVNLPRPRSYELVDDPEFRRLKQRLFRELHSEALSAQYASG